MGRPHPFPCTTAPMQSVEPKPPAVTPETILDMAPKQSRPLRVDANVIGYFGDMIASMRNRLRPFPRGVAQAPVPATVSFTTVCPLADAEAAQRALSAAPVQSGHTGQ